MVHSPLYGKDNYERITVQHADSPSISLSLHSNPSKCPGTTKSDRGKVTKITKFLCPLWKSEVGRGDPKEFPHQRGQSRPCPTQVSAGWQLHASHQKTHLCLQERLTEKSWDSCSRGGREWPRGKKMATGRKLDFATSTAHGTGCFTTVFVTEASKFGLSKNCVFLLSLTIVHQCFEIQLQKQESTIRLRKSNTFPI